VTTPPNCPDQAARNLLTSIGRPNGERITIEAHVGMQLIMDVTRHVDDHPSPTEASISSPLGSTLPSATVMSMVIVAGVPDAGFAADPPPVGDAVPPLKIMHSASPLRPSRHCVRGSSIGCEVLRCLTTQHSRDPTASGWAMPYGWQDGRFSTGPRDACRLSSFLTRWHAGQATGG
jgi:hypothetical protein